MWKVLEITFGVICGCLPAMRPIIKPLLPETLLRPKATGRVAADPHDTGSFDKLSNCRSATSENAGVVPPTGHNEKGSVSPMG